MIISMLFCYSLVEESLPGMICMSLASLIAIAGQLYAHLTKEKKESNAFFPVAATVRAFILWHLAVILTYHPEHLAVVFIFYFLFEIALYTRPEKEQI